MVPDFGMNRHCTVCHDHRISAAVSAVVGGKKHSPDFPAAVMQSNSHAVMQSCSTLTLQSAAAADRAGIDAAAKHQHGGCASLESMHPITAIVMHRDIQHEDAARSSASSHEALHRTEVGL